MSRCIECNQRPEDGCMFGCNLNRAKEAETRVAELELLLASQTEETRRVRADLEVAAGELGLTIEGLHTHIMGAPPAEPAAEFPKTESQVGNAPEHCDHCGGTAHGKVSYELGYKQAVEDAIKVCEREAEEWRRTTTRFWVAASAENYVLLIRALVKP